MDVSLQLLRDALERDDGKMSPLEKELNRQIEPGSGSTSDEGSRGSGGGSPRPSAARFEARRPIRVAASVVNLIGSGTAEPGVGPVLVVPSEI